MLIYPILAFFTVVIVYIHVSYIIFRLRYQTKQPLASSNDKSTGALLTMYLSLSFLVVVMFFCIILFFKVPRKKFWVY